MRPARTSVLVLALVLAPAPAEAQRPAPFAVLAKRGGAMEYGTYACRGQQDRSAWSQKVVELVDARTYASRMGKRQPGVMRYDRKSGRITFANGRLAGGFEAHYGQRADGRAVFVLVDRDVAPKPAAYDTCVRRET